MNSDDPHPPGQPAHLANRRADALLWLALLASALVFFGRFIAGRMPVSSDMSMMYAPFYSLKWDDGLPLWNRGLGCGMPMDGNLQFSALYPPRWPFYFLPDWRLGFGAFMFGHYLIALAGTAGALRSMNASRLAAFAGALAFACGSYMTIRIINTTIFIASCWLPFLVWGAAGRGRAAGAWAALGMAMIVLAGSPHLIVYGSFAFGVAWLVMHWPGRPFNSASQIDDAAPPIAPIAPLPSPFLRWVYFALGILCGAGSLIPGLALAARSVRRETDVANNLADSLRWHEIPVAIFGGGGGSIIAENGDKTLYLGGAALAAIVIVSLTRGIWRDRRWLCAAALALAGFILALGDSIGWQYLIPYIPGMNMVEGPARALALSALGLAMLFAFALDRLSSASAKEIRFGVLAVVGIAVALWFALGRTGRPPADVWREIGIAWLAAPASLEGAAFRFWNLPATLLPPALLALALAGRPRALAIALALVAALDLGHFALRVAPRTEPASYFDPSPQIRFLQNQRSNAPFRIAGYDTLQFHDTEWDSLHKFRFLTPNLATLYGLEDVRAFDPLTPKPYKQLVIEFGGAVAYNDPIRNLDLGSPDPALLKRLNVRYLIGDPRDRRLTNFPQTLTPANSAASVHAWPGGAPEHPISAWKIVSLIPSAGEGLRHGDEVARLVVDSKEGEFSFPVRYGFETGRLTDPPAANGGPPQPHMTWRIRIPDARFDYRLANSNYRATLEFGRPLRIRSARWELRRPDAVLFIAAQAYRLAPPGFESEWKLAFDDAVAPIYEFLPAAPRASLVADPGGAPEVSIDPAREVSGSAEIAAYGSSRETWRLNCDEDALLLVRSSWAPGWKARVGGRPAEVVRVNDVFLGVRAPKGQSEIQLIYRPGLFMLSAAASLAGALLLLALAGFERRRTLSAEAAS